MISSLPNYDDANSVAGRRGAAAARPLAFLVVPIEHPAAPLHGPSQWYSRSTLWMKALRATPCHCVPHHATPRQCSARGRPGGAPNNKALCRA